MNVLEVVDGQGRRRQIALEKTRLLIGREPSCDIHLPHPGVSRRHAQIQQLDQGRWLLQDLHSRNHVYVENKPIQQLVLEPRKPFRIAEYWLTLLDDNPTPLPEEVAAPPQTETVDTHLPLESPWLDQLQSFQRSLLHLEDPHAVLELLADEVQRVTRPRVLAIGIAYPQGYSWELVRNLDDQSPLRPVLADADQKVAEEQSSVQTWTALGAKKNGTGKGNDEPGLSLLVPMKGRQGVIGHIYLARPVQPNVPKPLQRYLSLLASFAGLAYDNLELGRIRHTQMEFEKEIQHARQIQLDLFAPSFEVHDLLDAFAVNLPSALVSGDYYDLVRTGPDTVAFVIADAMGHGLPAALLMASVRSGLRMGLGLRLPWLQVFQGLDELIQQGRTDRFVTGMVGAIDLRKGELTIVSAGHPAPSILVDGQRMTLPPECETRPWGIDLDTEWQVGTVPLRGKRWSILTYTDGVIDTKTRAQGYGTQRVLAFHEEHFHQSAEDLAQGLLNEVAEHLGPGPLDDDQTVLVLCSS